ncbi:MAG: hypothetical protein ACHQZR_05160 [Candidatus Limnocylindrales bacterium]
MPSPGVVVLDTRVADQAVQVVRSPTGALICIRVETIGSDVERCIPRDEDGRAVDRFWFGAAVAPGHWVVLMAVASADPYWKLARIEATTTDGRRSEATALADGTILFLTLEGELDRTSVWNTDGTLVQETWPSYDTYW